MDVDQRDRLGKESFSYRVSKEKLFIFWESKRVKTLRGKEAEKVLGRLEHTTSRSAQLIMAKLTGNFKRGNERK